MSKLATVDDATQLAPLDNAVHVLPDGKGVVAIAQEVKREWQMISGREYYYWNKIWIGADLWHVLLFFEEELDLVRFEVNKIRVKDQDGRWRKTDQIGLYSYLTDTGLVLLGSGLTEENSADILTKIRNDMAQGDMPKPEDFVLPKGTRIHSKRSKGEKSRQVRTLR